jgi:hypothetical protein
MNINQFIHTKKSSESQHDFVWKFAKKYLKFHDMEYNEDYGASFVWVPWAEDMDRNLAQEIQVEYWTNDMTTMCINFDWSLLFDKNWKKTLQDEYDEKVKSQKKWEKERKKRWELFKSGYEEFRSDLKTLHKEFRGVGPEKGST